MNEWVSELESGRVGEWEKGLRLRGTCTEHPSECNAERITFISPRGETVVARSAIQREGCSAPRDGETAERAERL